MLPITASQVLASLGHDSTTDFTLSVDNGVVSLAWHNLNDQPTDQQINDLANDVTPLPNGQLFSQWQARQALGFDPRVLHPYSFLNRFTTEERIAILTTAKTDPVVGLIQAELQTVSRVRLDADSTQNGVGYLAQQSIIGASRVTELLADSTAEEQ